LIRVVDFISVSLSAIWVRADALPVSCEVQRGSAVAAEAEELADLAEVVAQSVSHGFLFRLSIACRAKLR
jgi:hypothetical protein